MKSTYQNRARRVRLKIRQVSDRPRLSIHKSNLYLSVQLIDDAKQQTLVSAHEKKMAGQTRAERLAALGAAVAAAMKEKGVTEAVFDRGGNRYHGLVAQVAEAIRAGGINF